MTEPGAPAEKKPFPWIWVVVGVGVELAVLVIPVWVAGFSLAGFLLFDDDSKPTMDSTPTIETCAAAIAITPGMSGWQEFTECRDLSAEERSTARRQAVQMEAAGRMKPPAVYDVPVVADWDLRVQLGERECFGEFGGCYQAYRVTATLNGAKILDPTKTYTVRYEVRGRKDGVFEDYFVVKGNIPPKFQIKQDDVEVPEDGSDPTLTALVTAVRIL